MMSSPDLVYTNRVSAEIEAEAEKRRRKDREIAMLEHEIEQAWSDLAPSRISPVASSDVVHLLDQTATPGRARPPGAHRFAPRIPRHQVDYPQAVLLVRPVPNRSVQRVRRNADPAPAQRRSPAWVAWNKQPTRRLTT